MKLFLFLSKEQLQQFSSDDNLSQEENYRKHLILLQKLEDYFTIRPINDDNCHLIDQILTYFVSVEDYTTCVKIRDLKVKNKEIFSTTYSKDF